MQSIPTQSSKAQGQVLGVSGDGGVILGDDGVRYTFTSGDWRDFSAAAASGMRVEFSGAAPYATEVVVLEMPPQYAAAQAGAGQPGASPGYSGQQAYGGSSPEPGYGAVGGQQSGSGSRGTYGQTKYNTPVSPNPGVSKYVVAAMVLFLLPIAPVLLAFYLGERLRFVILFGEIVFILCFVMLWQSLPFLGSPVPLLLVFFLMGLFVGPIFALMPDDKFNLYVHASRYHKMGCGRRESSDNCLEPRSSRNEIPLCRQAELNRGL